MSSDGLPVDARVEPTREVLRRVYVGGGSVSLRVDDAIRSRAAELASQGWLVMGDDYPHFGSTYTQFKTGPRLSYKALKDI